MLDRHGKATLRYDWRLHHIGLGARHRASRSCCSSLTPIRIVTEGGELLRQLVLDPTRDYQRQSA